MFELGTLISFITASALLCLAPGPDNIFVLTQSILNGKRAGLAITAGICSGLIVHTLAVAFGLAVLFQMSTLAFNSLKVLGATYLLYLAWGAFRAANSDLDATQEKQRSAKAFFKKGAIMNMTNPKVAIFFLAFLPQFVADDAGSISMQLMALGILFIMTAAMVFGSIALLAERASQFLNRSPSSQKTLNRIAGTVFITMALKLLVSEH